MNAKAFWFIAVSIIAVTSIILFQQYESKIRDAVAPRCKPEIIEVASPPSPAVIKWRTKKIDPNPDLLSAVKRLESEVNRITAQNRALRMVEGKMNRVKMKKCVGELTEKGVGVWAYKPPGQSDLYCVYDLKGNVSEKKKPRVLMQ